MHGLCREVKFFFWRFLKGTYLVKSRWQVKLILTGQPEISLCNLCVLCVSVVDSAENQRDTEDPEVAQRRRGVI